VGLRFTEALLTRGCVRNSVGTAAPAVRLGAARFAAGEGLFRTSRESI